VAFGPAHDILSVATEREADQNQEIDQLRRPTEADSTATDPFRDI